MTNKYLLKIAAAVSDEKDTAKTFGKAWLAGHAGVLAGAALGGAALGSRAGRIALVKARRSGMGRATERVGKRMAGDLKTSRVGQMANKWFGGKTGPAAVGGVVGAVVGGDVGDYAGIRHGIIEAKKNKSNK